MAHEVHPDMSIYHVHVYSALREAWWYFGSAPSQYEIQLACRCSSTTVHQAYAELRRRGLITAPKHGTRVAKPTDLTRTISKTEPDPWADLVEDDGKPKYWKLPDDHA
jgi:DNA-binding GntR family transcriptional regulator